MVRRHLHTTIWLAAIVWFASSGLALAQASKAKNTTTQLTIPSNNVYDVLFPRYLQAAREMAKEDGNSIRWMIGLAADRRAREVNDLVTIRVIESIVATGSADAATTKSTKKSGGITNLFGLQSKLPSFVDPTSLIDTTGSSDFSGGGSTARSGDLKATVTARVVEVLPSGDLVIEGAREIDINGDRQVIVMTGVVRTADILQDNSVLSPRVGQLRIRYFGQGLIKDNLKPGWVVRLLNKIF
jgi:flagellar L-ring protein precursor FlgH